MDNFILLGALTVGALLLSLAGCSGGKKMEIKIPQVEIGLRSELDFDRFLKGKTEGLAKVQGLPGLPARKEEAAAGEPQPAKTAMDDSYKTDKEYLALKRFEQPLPIRESKTAHGVSPGETETVQPLTGEKPLIFAGEGFDIRIFEEKSREKMNFHSTSRLEAPPVPETAETPPERLDLREDRIASRKSLVFRARAGGFPQPVPTDSEAAKGPGKGKRKEAASVEKIPETRVFLTESGPSRLLLAEPETKIDALMGNDSVNRHRFENR
ncbi:MAG: hypothetical protein HZA02_02725 [Nitrospinae bacterium]|nr:hypothetical protein [Nitrospinota bacterium]